MRHTSLIQSLITSYPKNLGFTKLRDSLVIQNEEESCTFQSLLVPPVFCGAICVRMETSHVTTVCMTLWLGHRWFYKYYEFPILGTENILSMTLPYSWFIRGT